MSHPDTRQQEPASLPPDMYETSVSTSASGSWSTSGSRGRGPNQQQQQQSQQHGYHHRHSSQQQRHYSSNGSGRSHSPATSHSPTSVPSMGSQATPPPKLRGHSPTLSSHSVSPRTTRSAYQYQPHVPDESHSWTPAPPSSPYNSAASKLSSRYRPVGYRQDYSRAQHSSGNFRGEQQQQQQQQQQFYGNSSNSRQHSADREPRRDRERSPVSEPNFSMQAADMTRFSAYVNRFASHDPRSSPSSMDRRIIMEELAHEPQSPSVSERIQRFNNKSHVYPDPEPVYRHEDDSEQYMEQQQQQHLQYQQQRRQHTPGSRARALAQRFESSSGTPPHPRGRKGFVSPPPPPAMQILDAYSLEEHEIQAAAPLSDDIHPDEQFRFQEKTMPQRHLNHGMGGDVHPAATRPVSRHHQAAPPDHAHYEPEHDQDLHYQMPHSAPQQQQRSVTTEDIPYHYSLDDTIETPSIASVTELRRRLWDDDESLQVAVKPSLHQHGDAHSKHWMYFYGPEMAGRQGQRYGPDAKVIPRPDAKATRPRVTRSLSPARPQYRRRREQQQEQQQYVSQQQQQQYPMQQQQQRQEPVAASEPGQETSSNGVVFKSKFYQAAIAARRGGKSFPTRSPSRSPTQAATSNGDGGRKQQWLERAPPPQSMPDPATAPAPPPNNNMWRPVPSDQQQPDTIERVYSLDPTNGGNSDESSVARLVAQLNAVPRMNPASALQKIDSILRAESRSSSGGASPNVATGSTDHALENGVKSNHGREPSSLYHPHHVDHDDRHDNDRPRDGHEESSDEETDDETSVSSITNPTYASTKPAGDPDQPVSVPSLSTAMHRRPRPNPLQMYGQHQDVVRGKSSSKKKTPRSPPPETIKVGGKDSKGPKVVSPLQIAQSKDESDAQNASHHSSKASSLKSAAANKPKTAASIALKIRMWDDLSAPNSDPGAQSPQSPSSSGASATVLSTVNTEDLGSIMTPADAAAKAEGAVKAEAPVINRRSHPWDDHIPHNTKELVKAGDQFDVNPALLNDSPSPPRSSAPKKQHKTHTQNLSEDFDAAWVSLPANAFFPANPIGRDSQQQQRSNAVTEESSNPIKFQPKVTRNFKQRQPATRPPSNTFAGKDDRLPQQQSSPSRALEPVFDAFAGKEDLLPPPPTETRPSISTREQVTEADASKLRRSKLLNKMRKSKAATMAPAPAPPPQPLVFPAGSPTRTSKPLLSAYAMDSVDGRIIASKQKGGRSKSKSPGRSRLGSLSGSNHGDSGTNRRYLAKKFSRLMKVYDDKD